MKLVLYWPPEIAIVRQHLKGFRQIGKEKVDNGDYDRFAGYLNAQCLFPEDEAPIEFFGDFCFPYKIDARNRAANTGPCFERDLRGTLNLKWKIFADDMPPQSGQIDDIYNIPIHSGR